MVSKYATFTKRCKTFQHGSPKLENIINKKQSIAIIIVQEKFMKVDYLLRFINKVINAFQKGKNYGD